MEVRTPVRRQTADLPIKHSAVSLHRVRDFFCKLRPGLEPLPVARDKLAPMAVTCESAPKPSSFGSYTKSGWSNGSGIASVASEYGGPLGTFFPSRSPTGLPATLARIDARDPKRWSARYPDMRPVMDWPSYADCPSIALVVMDGLWDATVEVARRIPGTEWARNIDRLLEERGWSQRELAQKAGLSGNLSLR
jgi:hypothetical protein